MGRNLKMPWSMEDTIENMERIRDIMIKKVRIINLDGKAEEDVREINFDFCRVKKALEKQNPKKPIEPQEDYGTFMCPLCRGLIYAEDELKTHRFCLLCGQALDWEN